MANTLGDSILQHLKYVDGVEGILGQFYYLSDPDKLQQGIERWLLHSPGGGPQWIVWASEPKRPSSRLSNRLRPTSRSRVEI